MYTMCTSVLQACTLHNLLLLWGSDLGIPAVQSLVPIQNAQHCTSLGPLQCLTPFSPLLSNNQHCLSRLVFNATLGRFNHIFLQHGKQFQLRLWFTHPRANKSFLSSLPLKAGTPYAIQGLRLPILGNQSSTTLCYPGAKITNPWQSKQHNLVLSRG